MDAEIGHEGMVPSAGHQAGALLCCSDINIAHIDADNPFPPGEVPNKGIQFSPNSAVCNGIRR